MKLKSLFFLLSIIGILNPAYSEESANPVFPYQNCNDQNIKYTEQTLKNPAITEANFCPDCQLEEKPTSSLDEIFDFYLSSVLFPDQCFLAMSLRGINIFHPRRYFACNKNGRPSGRIRPCVTDQYIKTLKKVFFDMSKCFNYSAQRMSHILYLINKESGGIMNVRSPTGARCLGQVTRDYVKTINNIIGSRHNTKSPPLPHSEIYDEVAQRCGDIEDSLIKSNSRAFTCTTTHNPYTCLFYTFYGFEKNFREIQNNLNSKANYMEGSHRSFSEEEKERLQLPIKRNEMMTVELTVNGRDRSWLIWDDSELFDILDNNRGKSIKIKKVSKVPLFKNQEHVELMFNYWAHNGGQAYAKERNIAMVERLKRKLSRRCRESDKTKRCEMRKQVQKGGGADSINVLDFFERDILRNHEARRRRRRKEVAYYVSNIAGISQAVFGYKEGSRGTNSLLRYYKEGYKHKKKGLSLSDEEAKAFQEHVGKTCNELDFSQDTQPAI